MFLPGGKKRTSTYRLRKNPPLLRAQSRKPSRLDLFMFECEKNFEDRQCQKGGPELRVLFLSLLIFAGYVFLSPRVFMPNFIVG